MNVLIVGLGSIGLKHIKALFTIDEKAEIYALRSSRESGNIEKGVRNIYSIEEIKEKPDFTIIANPTRFHSEAIKKLVVLNCPLFIEKPVLSDYKEGEALRKIINDHKVPTYVACNLRFHPAIKYLKNWFSENNVQVYEVNIYCGSYLPDWRKNKDYRTVYSAHAEMGGGVHLDLIHELDYCYWLFGKPQKVDSVIRKVSALEIDSMDSAVYTLVYEKFTATIVLNYFRKDAKRGIEILTSEGTVYADILTATVSHSGQEKIEVPGYSMEQTYTDQMSYFISALRENRVLMNDFEEALSVLKIATAHDA